MINEYTSPTRTAVRVSFNDAFTADNRSVQMSDGRLCARQVSQVCLFTPCCPRISTARFCSGPVDPDPKTECSAVQQAARVGVFILVASSCSQVINSRAAS